MYWCPFCETLNKATAEDLAAFSEAFEKGKKPKLEIKICPDDIGKTVKDYYGSRDMSWLDAVAEIYGVEPTPRGMAEVLDQQLGFNLVEQLDAIEGKAAVVADSEVIKEIVDPQTEMAEGAEKPASAAFKEYITKLDGEALEPPLEVTSPVVGTNTGGAKPCPEMLEQMKERGGDDA